MDVRKAQKEERKIEGNDTAALHYTVHSTDTRPQADAEWDTGLWAETTATTLAHYMGDPPEHRPTTQIKILYDADALYVRFRVEDRYIIALETEPQSGVSGDSCVELFFTPGANEPPGYFNIEVNCVGTTLFHYQRHPGVENRPLDEGIAQLQMHHSIPGPTVNPEVTEPLAWTVGYRVPFRALAPYATITVPKSGSTWRANMYKCANRSSHPHWLTWSPVAFERPNFHLKEQFGFLHFT